MNAASRHEAGSTEALAEFSERSAGGRGRGSRGSARAIFDLRVWITADNPKLVYELVTELVESARVGAPAGVDVRYSQLRPGHPLCEFTPTLEPKHSKRTR